MMVVVVVVETGKPWERGQLGRSSRRWWEMDMNMVDQFVVVDCQGCAHFFFVFVYMQVETTYVRQVIYSETSCSL